MDEIEREAIRAEDLDHDDPALVCAIDMVRWELSMDGGDLDDAGDDAHDLPDCGFRRWD
jgi:hypothetical protein